MKRFAAEVTELTPMSLSAFLFQLKVLPAMKVADNTAESPNNAATIPAKPAILTALELLRNSFFAGRLHL